MFWTHWTNAPLEIRTCRWISTSISLTGGDIQTFEGRWNRPFKDVAYFVAATSINTPGYMALVPQIEMLTPEGFTFCISNPTPVPRSLANLNIHFIGVHE